MAFTATITKIKEGFRFAWSRFGWTLLFLVALGFVAGFSSALGIGIIIPLFALLTNNAAGTGFVTDTVRTILAPLHIPLTLESLLILMGILFIIKAVVQFLSKYINEKIAADYENQAREILMSKTLHASWPFLMEQKIGHLEKILMRDVMSSAGIIIQVSTLTMLVINFLMYAFIAFKISPPIMFVSSIFGAVLFLTLGPVLKRVRIISANLRDAEKEVAHFVNENIIGAKNIKAAGTEQETIAAGNERFHRYKKSRLLISFYQALTSSIFEPISFLFVGLLIWFYHSQQTFDIAAFAAIIYLIQKMLSFVQQGQNMTQSIIGNVPYFESMNEYNRTLNQHQEAFVGGPFNFKEQIEFKNVGFQYGKDKIVLEGFNSIIKKGSSVGLIGPSGSGKTTVADLLLRLIEPTSGVLSVDGRDVTEINIPAWRNKVGYMPQEVFLLNDTIENNIRFYNNDLTHADIERAAREANIIDFIGGLPNGFKAVVGERGLKISGGQRQRIALARVLARKPEILILDEATSSLDSESEQLIQQSLNNLKGKITVLIIAHRLSTIINADKVIVLKNGMIAEEGVPSNLIKIKESEFYKMYSTNN